MNKGSWCHGVRFAAGLIVIALFAMPAFAYSLSTRSSAEERKLSGITSNYIVDIERAMARWSVSVFTDPVHEEITNRIYGCNGDARVCAGDAATSASTPVLAGVRWNDDPPFRMNVNQAPSTSCKTKETIRFETQPMCWVTLFQDANKGAARGKKYGQGDAMLYRTHFGDLQFLHAMASRDGEPASETKARMMGWFEFTWRAAQGEYTLDTRLKNINNPTIQEAFGRTEWRLLDLYTQGAGSGLRRHVDDIAFGSLLHTLQDSYAAGHVEREESSGSQRCSAEAVSATAPGAILAFHAYNHQDHKMHAQADSRNAFMRQLQEKGNVVDIGRALVEARDQKMTWEAIRPMFDCLLLLQNPGVLAGPGDFVTKK